MKKKGGKKNDKTVVAPVKEELPVKFDFSLKDKDVRNPIYVKVKNKKERIILVTLVLYLMID